MVKFSDVVSKYEPIPPNSDFLPQFRKIPFSRDESVNKRLSFEDLSEDQAEVVAGAVDRVQSGYDTVTVGGLAGSGKSTIIPFIAEKSVDLLHTSFACFTGKATTIMKQKLRAGGIEERDAAHMGTLHSLMYTPRLDDDGIITGWSRKDKLADDDGRLITTVFVDEASMVGRRLLDDLKSYGVKIVLIGDHGQLPPVQDESVVSRPDFKLEKIHRQAADNPIIQFAHRVRTEGDIPRDFEGSENVQFISQRDFYPKAGEVFDRLHLEAGILVRTNRERVEINQAALGKLPATGNTVICLKNCPPIFNGMRGRLGKCKEVLKHWYDVEVEFPDDGIVFEGLINRHQFNQEKTLMGTLDLRRHFSYPSHCEHAGMLFDFGVAMTVHKAQGSQFKEAFVLPQKWSNDKEYGRWLYTAVTRAADKLYIVL